MNPETALTVAAQAVIVALISAATVWFTTRSGREDKQEERQVSATVNLTSKVSDYQEKLSNAMARAEMKDTQLLNLQGQLTASQTQLASTQQALTASQIQNQQLNERISDLLVRLTRNSP